MSPRLLSLLSLIEAELPAEVRGGAIARSADYAKGIARMRFGADGGGIVLQNFVLADGQLCVRVGLQGSGPSGGGRGAMRESAIYPQAGGFDWASAAARVAQEWLELTPATTRLPEAASA